MTTPAYQGTGQPIADGGTGILGRLGSFFGSGGSPTYAGDGQPSSGGGGGYLGGGTPAYVPAPPSIQPKRDTTINVDDAIDAQAATGCPIDSDALAAGQIAIVIPREYLRDQ